MRFFQLLLVIILGSLVALDSFAQGFLSGIARRLQKPLTLFLTEHEAGVALSRRILGAELPINRADAAAEVYEVLSHPLNRNLLEEVVTRVQSLEGRSLEGLRGTLDEERWIANEMAKILRFHEEGPYRKIRFASGEVTPQAFIVFDGSNLQKGVPYFFQGKSARTSSVNAAIKSQGPLQGLLSNPFSQSLRWEAKGNHWPGARETDEWIGLEIGRVATRDVEVMRTSFAPEDLTHYFSRGEWAYWPKMPYNTESRPSLAPFFNSPTVELWPARFTASRSVVVWDTKGGRVFSVKGPTNYPHRSTLEESKLDLSTDVQFGIRRSEEIARIDERLGRDPEFSILPEVLALRDLKTGNGIVVRDLSMLQDGNYYLPLFALQSELGRIVRVVPEALTEKYWIETLVHPLAKAKARFLIRYGFQFDTPHDQNILMQLDATFRPTGRFVFRDVADSTLYSPYLDALVGQKAIREYAIWERLTASGSLHLPTDRLNSYGFDMNRHARSISPYILRRSFYLSDWHGSHDRTYAQEILRLLGMDNSYSIQDLDDLGELLSSEIGQEAIRRFHQLP